MRLLGHTLYTFSQYFRFKGGKFLRNTLFAHHLEHSDGTPPPPPKENVFPYTNKIFDNILQQKTKKKRHLNA